MKQAAFLGLLAETRCVRTAARRIGMSRETAYRLRRKPGAGSFAAAWDVAMGRASALARKVTPEDLYQRVHCGLLKPLLRKKHQLQSLKLPLNLKHRLLTLDRFRSSVCQTPVTSRSGCE